MIPTAVETSLTESSQKAYRLVFCKLDTNKGVTHHKLL